MTDIPELAPPPKPARSPGFGTLFLAALIIAGLVIYAFKATDLMQQNALRTAFTEGDEQEIVRILTDMHEESPGDPVPLSLRAEVYMRMGKHDESIADYDKAIALSIDVFADEPDRLASAYLGRGMTHLAMGKTPEGLADLETAVETSPELLVAKNNLAWLLCTHPDDSVHDADRAITLATDVVTKQKRQHGGSLDTLAAAYARKGDFKKAIEVQTEAISAALDPDEILMLDKHMNLFLKETPVTENPSETYSPEAAETEPEPDLAPAIDA